MIKTIRWSPDTCECVIDFEYDTENPNVPHTGKEVVKACHAHQDSKDDPFDHHCLILEENQMKNKAVNKLKEMHGSKDVSFVFDEDRKLIIEVEGISNLQKESSNSEIEKIVGEGKAEVI